MVKTFVTNTLLYITLEYNKPFTSIIYKDNKCPILQFTDL